MQSPGINRKIRIALISPKGPLYRHRNNIWKKSLRYQPLTLTTLAALIPKNLPIKIEFFDKNITDIPLNLNTDLIAITMITKTTIHAYELADGFRKHGIPVVL